MTNAKNAEIAVRPGWVTVAVVVEATGYTAAYIRQLAGRGAVEALKVGRDWLVNLESVLDYQQAVAALGPGKHNPWRASGPRGGRKRALVSPGGQAATQEEN